MTVDVWKRQARQKLLRRARDIDARYETLVGLLSTELQADMANEYRQIQHELADITMPSWVRHTLGFAR